MHFHRKTCFSCILSKVDIFPQLFRLEQRIRSQEIHEKLGIISVTGEIRWRRLRYFGHLLGMDKNV